jgi:hypothetical protein
METVLSVVQLNVVAPSASLRLSWTISRKACVFLVGVDPQMSLSITTLSITTHCFKCHNENCAECH